MGRVISTCGFNKTGSTAANKLLQEFGETQAFGSFEFFIVHYPDGLLDLGAALNRHALQQVSITAIHRFRNLMKNPRLVKATNGRIGRLTDDFLDSIVQVKWRGKYSAYEASDKSGMWRLRRSAMHRMVRTLDKMGLGAAWLLMAYEKRFFTGKEMAWFPDGFDGKAKAFVSAVLKEMGRDESKITLLDNAFSTCDPAASFKFFDSPRAVIVNRDPRDQYVFTLTKHRAAGQNVNIPVNNVQNFITYYKATRSGLRDVAKHEDVLVLDFEELALDYDNTLGKLANFAGVKDHARAGEIFDPAAARESVRLFEKHPEYADDVRLIEAELREYLYEFD